VVGRPNLSRENPVDPLYSRRVVQHPADQRPGVPGGVGFKCQY
jgi:hypothetical protein